MACNRSATVISTIASWIYLCIIIFQLPLFRLPCRFGTCQSPIEVTSSQIIAAELYPACIAKALLYPAAAAKAFRRNTDIPSFDNFSKQYKHSTSKRFPAPDDLRHLEINAGCYLAVAGAIVGLLRKGRMSLFGILLIIWGFAREAIIRKSAEDMHIYPSMSLAAFYAFLSIKKDVRKLIHSWRLRRAAKSRRRLKKKCA